MIAVSVFLLWFIVISFLTFSFWLQPLYSMTLFGRYNQRAWAGSLLTVLFFFTCFFVGVMISIFQHKGVL